MNRSRVSVIIPVYNCGNSLKLTVNSALEQGLPPFEVIVVNDGSTDDTAAIASSFGNQIRYVEQTNQGQGAARNKGLQLARGEFIAFLDADDYWLENFIEKCVAFLEKHKDAIAVTTGHITKLVNGKELITPPCLHSRVKIKEPIVIENFFKFWAEQDHIRTGSNIIRKSVIDEAGLLQADLRGVSEDLEYWGYIATFGKWGFIPEPLWVGNSQAASSATGWFKKYKYRRKFLPSIDAWEKRIVPRLKDTEVSDFEVVRGRVAAGNAHNKIIAGDLNGALDIVQKYGYSMPPSRLSILMRTGAKFGKLSWVIACFIVRLKEYIKAWRLRIRTGVAN